VLDRSEAPFRSGGREQAGVELQHEFDSIASLVRDEQRQFELRRPEVERPDIQLFFNSIRMDAKVWFPGLTPGRSCSMDYATGTVGTPPAPR